MIIRAFIQARMTSTRLPGKVLARLDGIPVIARVVDRVSKAVPEDRIVVTTSRDTSDDRLAEYVSGLGVAVHRGPLDNVVKRFQLCLEEHPCDWFFRVCADSPLLDPALLKHALLLAKGKDADVITNVHPRTFPKGQSVELIRSEILRDVDADSADAGEQEHVTRYFYKRESQYKILNFACAEDLSGDSYVVDTAEDLARVSKLLQMGRAQPGIRIKE